MDLRHGLLTTLDLWSFKKSAENERCWCPCMYLGEFQCYPGKFRNSVQTARFGSKILLFFCKKHAIVNGWMIFFGGKHTSPNIFGKCLIKGPQTKSWNLSSRYDVVPLVDLSFWILILGLFNSWNITVQALSHQPWSNPKRSNTHTTPQVTFFAPQMLTNYPVIWKILGLFSSQLVGK